jgi:RES domain-containing protein
MGCRSDADRLLRGQEYPPCFDGTGAYLEGGRWNSPGRAAIYAATCLAGSLLEILVHCGSLQKLPGPHHCARAYLPEDLYIETLDEAVLPGWAAEGSALARSYGDEWLATARSAVLSVPAASARPLGRNYVLNPLHADYGLIQFEPPVAIVWDARLLREIES